MRPEIEHLSYSSISLYQTCGRAWRFRYVDRIEKPKAANLVFGSAFHSVIELAVAEQVAGKSVDLLALWKDAWGSVQQEPIDWESDLPERFDQQGIIMLHCDAVQNCIRGLCPMLDEAGKPVLEKRVELHVPGVPVPIIGYVDMIDVDGRPCDFKTASRAWTAEKASIEIQPLFYLAALAQMGYKQNPGLGFWHYVFVKATNPRVQSFLSEHKPSELFWLLNMIQEAWRGIDGGIYAPNPTSWRCSLGTCEYWDECRGK